MGLLSSLSRQQKEAIGLLQIGTFLEYFDLMLYIHMAVLLNELFFPQSDPHTASLLTAFALCSSLAFRPIGALFLGWIGDRIGRKKTIIITTGMMAVSCVVMANLPTYAQIGIAAAWIVTACRIFQGMSSMGEIVGAEIYLTESISRPARFPVVVTTHAASLLGGIVAIGVAFLVTSYNMNWRLAFWAGAVIAVVSVFARKRLRETPEFLKMQRQWMKQEVHAMNVEVDPVGGAEFNATWKEPINYKTLMSYFFISSGSPLCFFLAFFYFIPFLKENFGYSSEDIVKHNFFLSLVPFITSIALAYLSYRVHPLKIQKIRVTLALFLMILLPFLIIGMTSSIQLFLMQSIILILGLEQTPSVPIYLSHFPLYLRFRCAALLFSIARAVMYIITSFGMVYLTSYLGYFGIWVLGLPIAIASLFGISHFIGLERQSKLYPNLTHIRNVKAV